MQLSEIEQLLDKNIYGDLSSSRQVSPSAAKRQKGGMRYAANENGTASKDLFEVMIDLAIFTVVRLSRADSKDDHVSSQDASADFLAHVV